MPPLSGQAELVQTEVGHPAQLGLTPWQSLADEHSLVAEQLSRLSGKGNPKLKSQQYLTFVAQKMLSHSQIRVHGVLVGAKDFVD